MCVYGADIVAASSFPACVYTSGKFGGVVERQIVQVFQYFVETETAESGGGEESFPVGGYQIERASETVSFIGCRFRCSGKATVPSPSVWYTGVSPSSLTNIMSFV